MLGIFPCIPRPVALRPGVKIHLVRFGGLFLRVTFNPRQFSIKDETFSDLLNALKAQCPAVAECSANTLRGVVTIEFNPSIAGRRERKRILRFAIGEIIEELKKGLRDTYEE